MSGIPCYMQSLYSKCTYTVHRSGVFEHVESKIDVLRRIAIVGRGKGND